MVKKETTQDEKGCQLDRGRRKLGRTLHQRKGHARGTDCPWEFPQAYVSFFIQSGALIWGTENLWGCTSGFQFESCIQRRSFYEALLHGQFLGVDDSNILVSQFSDFLISNLVLQPPQPPSSMVIAQPLTLAKMGTPLQISNSNISLSNHHFLVLQLIYCHICSA